MSLKTLLVPKFRTVLVLLIVFVATVGLAIGSSAVWDPEPLEWQWAVSPRANSASFCAQGKICIEWCRISQGHIEEATGRLCCGTGDMVGSANPSCPG